MKPWVQTPPEKNGGGTRVWTKNFFWNLTSSITFKEFRMATILFTEFGFWVLMQFNVNARINFVFKLCSFIHGFSIFLAKVLYLLPDLLQWTWEKGENFRNMALRLVLVLWAQFGLCIYSPLAEQQRVKPLFQYYHSNCCLLSKVQGTEWTERHRVIILWWQRIYLFFILFNANKPFIKGQNWEFSI
jgi:hypothetical protein